MHICILLITMYVCIHVYLYQTHHGFRLNTQTPKMIDSATPSSYITKQDHGNRGISQRAESRPMSNRLTSCYQKA